MNVKPINNSPSPQRLRNSRVLALILAVSGLSGLLPPNAEAGRPPKTPPAQDSFTDHLSLFDTTLWMKADGWKNGSPFDNAWLADHIGFGGGFMTIRLDDQAAQGEPYSSGNYQTLDFYGYGCYEASFRPVAAPGVVTSLFTFAGPFDNGGNGKHNEIDIEFLGYDLSMLQTNFWTNDDSYTGGNEHIVELGFDASADFHRYGFKWTSSGIEWFVDGELVHQVSTIFYNPTPRAGDSLQKIMMNVWPVDETASGWAGTFEYPGSPLNGVYDWVRHIKGEDCSLADPPGPPPPPPDGESNHMHVQAIDLNLNNRATQVIARVSVVNGEGAPVAGAAVEGIWTGLITGGDAARNTDENGTATFYSARSRESGEIFFCVIDVSKTGMTYDVNDNIEDCDVIAK